MRLGALLGWGIVMYAIVFLLWSAFTIYGFVDGIAPRLAGLFVLIAVALLAGRSLRYSSWKDILPYSVVWTIEVAVLDIVLSVPFTGWGLFLDWNVWVGYSMVVLVPLFAPLSRRPKSSVEHHES